MLESLILDLLHDYYGPSIPLCQYPVYGTQGNPVILDLLVNGFLLDWLIDFSLTLYNTCNLIKQIYSQRTQEQNKTSGNATLDIKFEIGFPLLPKYPDELKDNTFLVLYGVEWHVQQVPDVYDDHPVIHTSHNNRSDYYQYRRLESFHHPQKSRTKQHMTSVFVL